MNWGKGLMLVMIAFAAMMAYFLVRAANDPEPLITERYYEQELKYQDRIDAGSRAFALGAVKMTVVNGALEITFPEKTHGQPITGNLQLLRTDDPVDDRNIVISCGPTGTLRTPLNNMKPGQYIAQLTWHANNEDLFTEQKIIVP